MKYLHAGGVNTAALIGAASFLLMVSTVSSLAQRGGPGATAAGRRIDTLNRQGEQYDREQLARDRKGKAEAKSDPRRAQEVAEQVKRDFEGLQAGYNKIVLAMASKESLDSDSVLNSVAEVKKCAARLKDHLALPHEKKDEAEKAKSEAGDAQLKDALLLLRKHIYSFVTNPLFEAPPVINVEQASKAGRDLDIILELSEDISRRGSHK